MRLLLFNHATCPAVRGKQVVKWSPLMEAILQQNIELKSSEQLAVSLRVGTKELRRKIKQLGLVKIDRSRGRPRVIKVKAERPKRGRSEQARIRSKQADQLRAVDKERKTQRLDMDYQRMAARKKRSQPKFQTRQVDYNRMKRVRIDAKTSIYIKPDADPEAAIQLFLKVNKNYVSNRI